MLAINTTNPVWLGVLCIILSKNDIHAEVLSILNLLVRLIEVRLECGDMYRNQKGSLRISNMSMSALHNAIPDLLSTQRRTQTLAASTTRKYSEESRPILFQKELPDPPKNQSKINQTGGVHVTKKPTCSINKKSLKTGQASEAGAEAFYSLTKGNYLYNGICTLAKGEEAKELKEREHEHERPASCHPGSAE